MCDICCEPFTNRRHEIHCSPCGQKACSACYLKYLEERHEMPACMFCRATFDLSEFLRQFPRSWITKKLVPYIKRVEHTGSVEDMARRADLVENYKHYLDLKHTNAATKRRMEELKNEVKRLKHSIDATEAMVDAYEDADFDVNLRDVDPHVTTGRSLFRYRCFDSDCPGFLNDRYTCSACDTTYCSECHTRKSEAHVCDAADVETVNVLRESVKPCPSCGVGLSKIEGCDQFFCTSCKTCFDWRTGRILNTRGFDNPHYFEWRRHVNGGQAERQHGDVVLLEGSAAALHKIRSLYRGLDRNTYRVERQILRDFESFVHSLVTMLHMSHRTMDENNKKRRRQQLEYATGSVPKDAFEKVLWKLRLVDFEHQCVFDAAKPFGLSLVNELDTQDDVTLNEYIVNALNVLRLWRDVDFGTHPMTRRPYQRKRVHLGVAVPFVLEAIGSEPITVDALKEMVTKLESPKYASYLRT